MWLLAKEEGTDCAGGICNLESLLNKNVGWQILMSLQGCM
jgi:hypothetical protein